MGLLKNQALIGDNQTVEVVTGINGTAECLLDEETGKTSCMCTNAPKNFNAVPHYLLQQAVFASKLHKTRDCEKWEDLSQNLFSVGAFKKYNLISGKTLKSDLMQR